MGTYLTPTQVVRESLRILHQKATFIGSIERQYDDQYAKKGAKVGDTIKLRLPNQYKSFVGQDQTANFQDTIETSVDLQISTYRSIPLFFDDTDLTMRIDDFSDRYLAPAMAQLAADMEKDAYTMYADVSQQVGAPGTIPNTLKVLNQARAKMTDSLTPAGDRTVIMNTDAQVEIVDAVKGLFHDQSRVAKQYREGIMGTTAGFGDIYESTMIPVHTNGTATGVITVTGAPVEGSSVINLTGTAAQTLTKGTGFTIAGRFAVHPETKVSTAKLQQYVVTATATAVAGAYTAVAVSPAFIAAATNAKQNIASLPAATDVVTLSGAASTGYAQNLAYHKEAFAFVTADLFMPQGTHFAGRDTMDGISLRITKDWDIKTGRMLCRADCLYGFKAIRPSMACRVTA